MGIVNVNVDVYGLRRTYLGRLLIHPRQIDIMLKEMKNARQWPGEPERRVFADGDFDLFVWCGEDGTIARFQVGYDKARVPRAFDWSNGVLVHYRVDSGQGRHTQIDMTSLLRRDAAGDAASVAGDLERVGIEGEEGWILAFVIGALRSSRG